MSKASENQSLRSVVAYQSLELRRVAMANVDVSQNDVIQAENRRKLRVNLIKFYEVEDDLNFVLTPDNLYVLNPARREESYYWNAFLIELASRFFVDFPGFFGTGFQVLAQGSIEVMSPSEIALEYGKEVAGNVTKPFANIGKGITVTTETFAAAPVLSTVLVISFFFGGYLIYKNFSKIKS